MVLNWAVDALAKGGKFSIVGVYADASRTFPVGIAMDKNLTIRMGNCDHRKYIPRLVKLVGSQAVDPGKILSLISPIMTAIDAYKHFYQRQEGWMKVMLQPASAVAA